AACICTARVEGLRAVLCFVQPVFSCAPCVRDDGIAIFVYKVGSAEQGVATAHIGVADTEAPLDDVGVIEFFHGGVVAVDIDGQDFRQLFDGFHIPFEFIAVFVDIRFTVGGGRVGQARFVEQGLVVHQEVGEQIGRAHV